MESQYLVVIEVCGPRQTVQQQLTYEVTHLCPGQNQWSLVSRESSAKPPRLHAEAKTSAVLRK